MDIDEYVTLHSDAQPPVLERLYRHTHLTRLYPRMCCEPIQGRLLKMLTSMIKPLHILELGTFSGYSTLCFAEGMPSGAEIHTVEIDDEAAPELEELFAASPRGNDIHLHIGDALAVVPKISDVPWDMVYIDANKRQYVDYYLMIKPLMANGGYILADNTLWSGKVLDPVANHDAQTRGVDDFNRLVATDTDVEKVMIPLRDGLTLIRLK
ncbi:MAG: O-methyltransferase [Odoribacter sp.]|nr:O-methyltransferase [Odoribacter sp.]